MSLHDKPPRHKHGLVLTSAVSEKPKQHEFDLEINAQGHRSRSRMDSGE